MDAARANRWGRRDATAILLAYRLGLRATCCGIAAGTSSPTDGQDTRAIQHYLGHRSIASTVRYTKLAPDRFKGFWKD